MKTFRILVIFVGLAVLLLSPVSAEDASAEYKIKAGYLYNFTKFITWPEDDSDTFNLCIVGDDPFGGLIDPIEQRSAFGHPIKLFRLPRYSPEQRCHILFISASIKDNLFLKGMLVIHDSVKPLTVGENQDFAAQGGMVGFINRDGRIKLQINLKTLQQNELKISAKLLEVSEIIEGDGQ
jgi:hypothetical protein